MTKALSNAIKLDRVPQGVLFAGVRGVGKTTTARLFAKALNCDALQNGEPCNRCESCVAINQGSHEDVLEIDGASHTGIDDIRELQETLDYVPQRSRFKVYIIDEVHMLSQSAFNALLKSIEEPPEHVIFAFATTELQKVPDTILSRCQIFRLRHISLETTLERLRAVLQAEGVEFEDAALVEVARSGRGSMRDALTFLDQVIALGQGSVTAAVVNSLTNAAASDSYISFLQAMIAKDAQAILDYVEAWHEQGVSLQKTTEELAKIARHGFIVKQLGIAALNLKVLGLAPEEVEALKRLADQASELELNQMFRSLVQISAELDGSELDRFILENGAFEWCLDPGFPNMDDLSRVLSGGSSSGPARAPGGRETLAPSAAASGTRAKPSLKSLKDRLAITVDNDSAPAPSQPPVEAERATEQPDAAPAKSSQPNPLSELANRLKKKIAEPSPALASTAAAAAADAPAAEEDSGVTLEPAPAAPSSVRPYAWPASWKLMVELLMREKALLGRKLEDTVALSYGRDLIRLRVDAASLGGRYLLAPDTRSQALQLLRDSFNFSGELQVEGVEAGAADHSGLTDDTVLAVHQEEKKQKRLSIEQELRSHPLTTQAQRLFNATITSIEFSDQP